MIVTERMLAFYRTAGRPLSLGWPCPRDVPGVPFEFFSDSEMFLGSFWGTGSDGEDPARDLQAVPVLAFTRSVPVLRPGREWVALRHQAGGYSCEKVLMIATRLEPRPALKPALDAIVREGYFAEDGRFDRHDILASRIAWHVKALAGLDLDCESSWRLLTESVYPIDATQDNLDRLAVSAPVLDEIADWTRSIRVRYSRDPVILLLTRNSD